MKVLLPRAQYAGVNVTNAELHKRQDYNLEAAQSVPGMGTVQLIVQQQAPRMVFQLIEDEIGTDEPGAAGNQYNHVFSPSQ